MLPRETLAAIQRHQVRLLGVEAECREDISLGNMQLGWGMLPTGVTRLKFLFLKKKKKNHRQKKSPQSLINSHL